MANNICILFHDVRSAEWFSQAIDLLSRRFRFVSGRELDRYYRGEEDLTNACLLTFDDGWNSTYDVAFPALREKGIPALLFVSPRIIRNRENYWFQKAAHIRQEDFAKVAPEFFPGYSERGLDRFPARTLMKTRTIHTIQEILDRMPPQPSDRPMNMDSKKLKELRSSGIFEIGAHTINHPILSNETAEQAAFEIERSITELRELLDAPVHYFAYPNGFPGYDFSEREYRHLEAMGIRLAFSTMPCFFKKSDHPLAVPRIELAGGGSLKMTLKTRLLPYFRPLLNRLNPPKDLARRAKIEAMIGRQG